MVASKSRGAAMYSATIGNRRYAFSDLKTLLAKASPTRSGDGFASFPGIRTARWT